MVLHTIQQECIHSTTNNLGCDSTATLNLTITNFTTSNITLALCDSNSYDWNGTTYTTSGVFTFDTTNAAGCDSTVTINLSFNFSSFSVSNIISCDSYDWNGITYDSSGVYTFNSINSYGCLNVDTLN